MHCKIPDLWSECAKQSDTSLCQHYKRIDNQCFIFTDLSWNWEGLNTEVGSSWADEIAINHICKWSQAL